MSIRLRAAALAVALAAPAAAHIVADPNKGAADSYFRTALRLTHGCHGSPTVAVRVTIPDGVHSVKAQPKPGWAISFTRRKLDQPIVGQHGHPITEAVTAVEWRGGPLSDAEFEEFGLSMRLPAGTGRLWFPVLQQCVTGETRWSDIPADGQRWGSVPNPAPFVTLEAPR